MATTPSVHAAQSTPFRFYDNRQKYLAFVTTCNEKSVVAARCAEELTRLEPTPPALRLFDAGMGDGTVLSRVLRTVHHLFPTVPVLVVAKELSLEDVRLGLEKLPDRFVEHPHTVLVVTNLSYADAPALLPSDPERDAAFWAELSGWEPVDSAMPAALRHRSGRGPLLELCAEPRAKGSSKNRIHRDIRLETGDEADAVLARVGELGGHELHPDWGDLPWRVVADPSGNELCLLPARTP